MPQEHLELRRIEFLKDGLVAGYHARVARWNLLHQAGLALLGLAGYGLITEGLTSGQTLNAVLIGLASIAVAALLMDRHEKDSNGSWAVFCLASKG